MAEVKSAQITISEHWHDHVHHKTVGKAPRWDTEQGVICACGEVLGWPDPEHKETLSQYLARTARAPIDSASAPGRVKGAFGTYGRPVTDAQLPDQEELDMESSTKVAPDGDLQSSTVDQTGPVRHDDDPGPDEPELPDWGEPPADEPEPQVLAIDDADDEDVGSAPTPEGAELDERGNLVFEGKSYGPPPDKPADEAQTESDLPPWDTEPEREGIVPKEWIEEAAAPENADRPRVGSDVVPYAGTPIMPTDAEVLDPLVGRLAPLDPTQVYTPADVELKIVEILRQLENSELFLRQQLARLHQATHNHDYRYNLAVSQSKKKAQDQRKADAWLATERERHEMTEAEMLVRALRDSQHNLRAQLSGFQSVARSLAVSMVNALDGRDKPPTRAIADRLPPEPSHWDR